MLDKLFGFDLIGLAVLVLAIATGVGVYFAAYRLALEGGLRNRRSPNQVGLEALGAALIVAAAVGTLASWTLIVFIALAFVAALLIFASRGGRGWTLAFIAAALVFVALSWLGHRHASKPAPLVGPSSMADPASAPIESKSAPPAKDDADEEPLIKPAPSASPPGPGGTKTP